jgi:hypothetical protein
MERGGRGRSEEGLPEGNEEREGRGQRRTKCKGKREGEKGTQHTSIRVGFGGSRRGIDEEGNEATFASAAALLGGVDTLGVSAVPGYPRPYMTRSISEVFRRKMKEGGQEGKVELTSLDSSRIAR